MPFIALHVIMTGIFFHSQLMWQSLRRNKVWEEISIPDGISNYSSELDIYYEKIRPLLLPKDLFMLYKPNSKDNPYSVELTKAEIDFVKRFYSIGESLRFIPSERGRKPQNDFIWKGKEWELKTLVGKSGFTIANAIWRATDRGKSNIILDTTFNSKLNLQQIIQYVLGHLRCRRNNRKVHNLIVVRREKFVRIK